MLWCNSLVSLTTTLVSCCGKGCWEPQKQNIFFVTTPTKFNQKTFQLIPLYCLLWLSPINKTVNEKLKLGRFHTLKFPISGVFVGLFTFVPNFWQILCPGLLLSPEKKLQVLISKQINRYILTWEPVDATENLKHKSCAGLLYLSLCENSVYKEHKRAK